MYALGIETSSKSCSVTVFRHGSVLYTKESVFRRYSQSEVLPDYVNEVLLHNKISPSEISEVLISEGPGSFTGLRVGFGFIKGLLHGKNIPVFLIPTLILPVISALRSPDFSPNEHILSIQKASSKEQIYVQQFDCSGAPISPAKIGDVQGVLADSSDCCLVGDLWALEPNGVATDVIFSSRDLYDAKELLDISIGASSAEVNPLYLSKFQFKTLK